MPLLPASPYVVPTGQEVEVTIPADVSSITVDMAGAQGGKNPASTNLGGLGQRLQVTIPVTPGEVLYLGVGTQGASPPDAGLNLPGGAGGWPGGAKGGDTINSGPQQPAGGGGGCTYVKRGGTALANRILVAAGGGGVGNSNANAVRDTTATVVTEATTATAATVGANATTTQNPGGGGGDGWVGGRGGYNTGNPTISVGEAGQGMRHSSLPAPTVTGAHRSGDGFMTITWTTDTPPPPGTLVRDRTLYPANTATVDTGTGIDVRLLTATLPAAVDNSQTATFTHANDSVNRTFDPATAGVTAANDSHTLMRLGWALTVANMTPSDDVRCNAILPPGALTVNTTVVVGAIGSLPTTGGPILTMKASLWRYNPATDAGTLIATGIAAAATAWTINSLGSAENNVAKNIAIPITVPSAVEFSDGEVLLLQIGFITGVIPNPLTGTTTYTATLRIGQANANVTFAVGQGIRQRCRETQSSTGVGTAWRTGMRVRVIETATGVGVPAVRKAIRRHIETLPGVGVPSKVARVRTTKTATGVGSLVSTRRVRIAAAAVGVGVAAKVARVRLKQVVSGAGALSFSRRQSLTRYDVATGVGTGFSDRSVIFVRQFTMPGVGEAKGRIALPMDRLPEPGDGGGVTVIRPQTYIFDD